MAPLKRSRGMPLNWNAQEVVPGVRYVRSVPLTEGLGSLRLQPVEMLAAG